MAYKQAKMRRSKLEKTYNKSGTRYYPGGVYYDEELDRYFKYDLPRFAKYLRKVSNKKVRKAGNLGQRGNYRKLFDYKWELY